VSELALEITDLHVSYGRVRAVQGLTLEVRAGQVVALLGPNGAGKSSTLRAISGQAPIVSGSVRALGSDLRALKPDKIVGLGVAHVPEGREVFASLTVQENLEMGATARGGLDQLDVVYALFPRLKERYEQRAGTLSGGEQQMLAIGRALMSEPRLLLLDEPSMGLAPIVVKEVMDRLREVASRGMSVLLVEQNAAVALDLADYAYVVSTGFLRRSGAPEEIGGTDELMAAYLGG
jgi:branched-chain amino acid transport system ATP-binding protein